ncbi:MAG: hypothetical protein PGN24_02720 [Microbacterium arborescens]
MSRPPARIAVRRAAPWAIGLACVVGAWFVALVTPPDSAAWEPFTVEAHLGEPAVGRNIAVTVNDVTRADSVSSGPWHAEGTWVVVDLAAEAVATERGALLSNAVLVVDGRTYRATERRPSMLDARLSVGVARTGSLGFELPADASGPAVLQLALNPDTRVDSLIEYRVDLDALVPESDRELLEPSWEAAP